jgi:hypothetical protein
MTAEDIPVALGLMTWGMRMKYPSYEALDEAHSFLKPWTEQLEEL